MTRYLTIDDAMQVVERLGFHVRDAGLLASAIARPAATYAGDEIYPTIESKAAAQLESLLRNHALVDGNKRTGWVLTQLLLWLNGYRHTFTTDEAFDLVVGVAEGALDAESVARELGGHLTARQ